MKKISIIIPFYNEGQILEKFVLDLQKKLKNVDSSNYEIIFVDGGSTDNSLSELEKNYKIKYKVIKSQKGRGKQLIEGVKNATFDNFFFLHTDSILPDDFFDEIQEVLENYEVGFFGIEFDDNSILMRICAFMSNIRAKNGIIFGDQGMFITKKLYDEIGGFLPLNIMEDYAFSIRLKNYLLEQKNIKKSKINVITEYFFSKVKMQNTKSKIKTSARRFKQNGTLKTMLKMQKLRYDFRKNVDIERIEKEYK